jgi:hypothetical protein
MSAGHLHLVRAQLHSNSNRALPSVVFAVSAAALVFTGVHILPFDSKAYLRLLGMCSHPLSCMRACAALPAPQDLKCFVFSLISAHFKIQPIQK